MDLNEVQEAMLPGAKAFLKKGLTLGKGKKALTLAAVSLALEETDNNQNGAARKLGITQAAISEMVNREESLTRFRRKKPEQK